MSYSKFLDAACEYGDWRRKNNFPDQHYEKLFADTRDIWIKDGRFDELISFILENWDSGNCDDFIPPLITALIEQKKIHQLKRLWKGIIRYRVERLWEYADQNFDWKELDKINVFKFNIFKPESYNKQKREAAYKRKFTLAAIDNYIECLHKLDALEEIERVSAFRKNVSELQKPKPNKTTDKRKIDEHLFWELIESSRSNSQDQYEFIDILKAQLESFKPIEIRSFQKIFLSKFTELSDWDIWALAYIVRRGCGDDEFDYFKAWVISKGQKAYEGIKALNHTVLVDLFNEDPQLEEFMYLAEQVYENKTNDLMKPVRIKVQKIKGKPWDENKIDEQYPELCELFKYKST